MPRVAFADESGTDANCGCYAIGVASVAAEHREAFEARIAELKGIHGVQGEAKWTRVRKGHGAINFVLDSLAHVLDTPSATFDVIVVKKALYNNWQGGAQQQETAFYKTYTYLLRHITRRAKDTTEVFIDAKSAKYPKHHEAIQTIGNRMLAKLAATGALGAVTPVSSHESLGIQLADVLTGAINSAHLVATQKLSIHYGKQIAIQRLAAQLGWDHLAYDTYPHPKLNIWHFPTEFRGPSRDPKPSGTIPYVNASDVVPG
jgi:hypothetical protein